MHGKILHKCSYCNHTFKSEARFIKHECKEMLKDKKFKSILGQSAYVLYKKWIKSKHRRSIVSPETFKNSKYFNSFCKFVEFTKKANIPDYESYLEIMIKNKVDPVHWTSPLAYQKYLEYMAYKSSPQKLSKITIKTFLDIAEDNHVSVNKIFDILTPTELIQLLHQQKVSPWILLNSKKFTNFYINASDEEKKVIKTIINPEYWAIRFKKAPEDIKIIKEYIKELDL